MAQIELGLKKAIQEYNEFYKDVEKANKSFEDSLVSVTAIIEKYKSVSTTKGFAQFQKELNTETVKANKSLKEQNTSLVQLERAEKALIIAQSEAGKRLAELRVQTRLANKANTEAAQTNLNTLTSYQRLGRELAQAREQAREFGITLGRNSREYVDAKNKVKELDDSITQLDNDLGQFQRKVGNYPDLRQLENLVGGLNPLLGSVVGKLGNVNEKLLTIGETLRTKGGTVGTFFSANLLNPIALGIGAIGAVVAATALDWYNYNEQIIETKILTEQITKLQGDLADKTRLAVQALSQLNGEEYQRNLEVARTLTIQFGEDYQTVIDEITLGTIKGGKANKEYIDSLGEYATFFAQAGFSIRDFVSIVNAGFDLGIYTDKLPDAIKEFDISLREQTKSTKEALINAFGVDFTNILLEGVRTGAITTREALDQIAQKTKEVGVDSQQAAQLTADLFRGAGEDAGGYLKIIEAVNKAQQDQTRELTEQEKVLQDYNDALLRTAKAKDDAFNSDSFIKFQNDFNIRIESLKTNWYTFIAAITGGINEIDASVDRIVDRTERKAKESSQSRLSLLLDEQIRLRKEIEADKKTADEVGVFAVFGLNSTIKRKEKTLAELQKRTQKILTDANTEQEIRDEVTPDNGNRIDTATKKTTDDTQKLAEKAKKEREEAEKKRVQEEIKGLEATLKIFEITNQSKIKDAKDLSDAIIQVEKDRISKLEKLEIGLAEKKTELNENQKRLDAETVKQKFKNNEDLTNDELNFLENVLSINEKYKGLIDKIDSDYEKEKNDRSEKAIKREEKVNETILKFYEERANDEKKTDLEKEQEIYIQRKLYIERNVEDEANKNLQLEILDKEYIETTNQLKQAEREAELAQTANLIGQIGNLFERQSTIGKAAAIAQATINTYLGATAALKLDPPFSFIQAGLTIGFGLAQVARIAGIEIPQFATGTDFAPKGFALTQEDGAEIITDRKGKVKSWGSDSGAQLTYLQSGDKVFNATKSKLIKQAMTTATDRIPEKEPNVIVNVSNDFNDLIKTNKKSAVLNAKMQSRVIAEIQKSNRKRNL